jgi:hypothetical protein
MDSGRSATFARTLVSAKWPCSRGAISQASCISCVGRIRQRVEAQDLVYVAIVWLVRDTLLAMVHLPK